MLDKIEHIRKAKYLLFDLDGTLVNTDYANFLSYKKAIEQVKNSKSNLSIKPTKRVTRKNIRMLVPNLSDKEYAEIIRIKDSQYRFHLKVAKLNRTVASMLDKYSDKHTILATNSRKKRADLLLNHFNLADKFTKKYYRENITTNNKFQHILATLHVEASLVFVFENDESEIDAAIMAGILPKNILKVA